MRRCAVAVSAWLAVLTTSCSLVFSLDGYGPLELLPEEGGSPDVSVAPGETGPTNDAAADSVVGAGDDAKGADSAGFCATSAPRHDAGYHHCVDYDDGRPLSAAFLGSTEVNGRVSIEEGVARSGARAMAARVEDGDASIKSAAFVSPPNLGRRTELRATFGVRIVTHGDGQPALFAISNGNATLAVKVRSDRSIQVQETTRRDDGGAAFTFHGSLTKLPSPSAWAVVDVSLDVARRRMSIWIDGAPAFLDEAIELTLNEATTQTSLGIWYPGSTRRWDIRFDDVVIDAP